MFDLGNVIFVYIYIYIYIYKCDISERAYFFPV